MTLPGRRTSVLAALGAALALAAGTLATPAGAAPGSSGAAPGSSGSYVNPVTKQFADTFADPAVVRGRDGWWYSYATTAPLRSGEGTAHRIPMARSRDLVDWQYVGDAFGPDQLPSWAAPDAALWAPDVR